MSASRATEALGMTLTALVAVLSGITRRTGGTMDVDDVAKLPTCKDVQVGDIVAVYGHQRYRIAKVWAVTPSKLSAVYITPTALVEASRYGRPPYPNNITGKKAVCGLVERATSQPAVDEVLPACEGADDLCGAPAGETCEPGCPSLAVDLDAPAPVASAIGGGRLLVEPVAGMFPLAGGSGFLF